MAAIFPTNPLHIIIMMRPRMLLLLVIAALPLLASSPAEPPAPHPAPARAKRVKLTPHAIRLGDSTAFSLLAPATSSIHVAAEGMGRLRFMAMSPDGRLFATDMHTLDDNEKGRIYILDRFDTSTGRFASKRIYLDHLRNPNSIAFYRDRGGREWLYVALTDRLIRYRFMAGDTIPGTAAETLTTFPAYGLSYKYGGWHLTRTIAIHDEHIYLSVGSSCNACEEKEPVRASIIRMNPDGSEQSTIATGLRNAVGMKWVGEELFATDMGADHLGDDKPNDMLYTIRAGTDYGWPYCYVWRGGIYPDRTIAWEHPRADCAEIPPPQALFPAHSAPLGLEHFGDSFVDRSLRGSLLVALHGSGLIRLGTGYCVVRVAPDHSVTPFITGFLRKGTRYGRPVDVLIRDDRSFFFTDDFRGVLYYVEMRSGG